MKLKTIFLFIPATFLHTTLFSQEILNKQPFIIGESIEIKSPTLGENRVLNIYLPASYNKDSLKRYPVIYLLDGSADEDFIHIAGLVQFGSFSWIKMIPESIVVGIANIDRRRDFTFATHNKKDKENNPTSGGSERFIDFIEQDLQPFIEKNYHTDTVKTLIGQSLGGLLATEILLKKPGLFTNYIIVSPSLWWDNESLLRYSPVPLLTGKSIYIGVGKEGDIMERPAKQLYDKLNSLKENNTRIFFDFLDKLNHGDALHLAVYHAFEKIFRNRDK